MHPGDPSRQRGFALLIVLWTVVLLTALATQLTASGRAEVRLAANLRGAAVAQALADGVVYTTIFEMLARPGPWPPDPMPRTERLAGATATIRLASEDGKLDLNTVPTELMAALLQALGVARDQARQLSADITLWRFPSADTAARSTAYAQAGLGYVPPGALYQSVAELSQVLGMTPTIYARLRPHVTVFHEGDADPRAADPIVQALLGRPVSANAASMPAGQVRIAVIDVEVVEASGSVASRRAVARIGGAADRGGWSILDWN